MNIAVGSGANDMSQILAGGALTVTGGTIVNKGLTVDAPTVQTGTVMHSYVEAHSGDDERVYQIAPYNLTTNSTAMLAAARQEGNVAVAVGNPSTGALSLGQTGAGTQAAGGVSGSAVVNPIIQVPSNSDPGGTAGVAGATAVRTSVPNVAIPSASLFRTLANPSSRYLIETDPRFANYRNWLSSDYLLNNLGLDPNTTLKRLGDGFYEERLIREQVAQLTGYRYLDGFTSDDAQYAALMNAGAAFAQQYGLRVGVALTAAQMAQLTSDIVWLVEQTVTLPDGSTQRVLVPQVYVRVKPGDIDGSGALLSGSSVDMRLTGDLTNSGGTIAGRQAVALSADNINNLAGRITGEDVTLTARTDINVIGAVVDASKSLTAIAGRDINVVTTTRDSKSDTGPLARSSTDSGVNLSATTLDRVAGLYVTNPGGSLNVVAMRDANLIGAEIKSAGDATVVAGRDVNLGTVTTGRTDDIRWSSDNTRKDESSQEIGTTISGAGNVSVGAGRNLTGVAATLNAGETLELSAGAKLTLVAGQNSTSSTSKDSQKDGLSHSSSSADSQETSLTRTTLTGKNIQLTSGDDMTLSAIEANAESLGIQAGGKLNLLTQKTTSAFSGSETDGDGAWVSAKSAGHKDETSQYNLFNVQNLSIKASGGVTAQLGQNDALAALAQQPGMAWVNQLANDPAFANSVEWQRVQEEHKKWAQSQTTMGPVAAIVVSVVVGMVAGPVAAQAGTAASGAAASAGLGTTISAGVGSAVQIGVTALASQAAVSFVNNDGDIGKVLKEMGSSESIKNIATAMVTAGVLQGLSEVLPENLARATNGSAKFGDQLQRQLIDGAASAVVRSAINGTSLEDELRSGLTNALLNTVAAQSADGIGQLKYDADINAFTQNVLHAIAGCAVGAVRADSSSGCGAGALGAVIGELTASAFGRDQYGNVLPGAVEMTQVLAVIAGAVAGLDAEGLYIAAASSANAAINNALTLRGSAKLMNDLRACSSGTDKSCDVAKLREEMMRDSDKKAANVERDCGSGGSLNQCLAASTSASLSLKNLTEAYLYADTPEKKALINDLVDRQVADMTKMYESLEMQHSAAGAGELLRAAIVGALPYASVALGSMLGTKLGGLVVKAPIGGNLAGATTCSFRGDMQVKTRLGYTQIKDIRVGDGVYARNELDGMVSYKTVLAQYSNPYKETVYVSVKDMDDRTQVIVSNAIHPFFAQVPGMESGTVLPKASEGHDYRGPILRAQWVDAANLKTGYRLLGSSGNWLEVTQIQRTTESLQAYNLTVADFHTYFVMGGEGQEGVWVHNTCAYTAEQLPNARPIGTKNANGREEYSAVVNAGTKYQETRVFYKGADGNYYDSLQTYDGKMLGIDGAQTASKTMWRGDGKSRIDVENPNPGQRAGQIHYQDENNNKYYYDANKKIFYNENSMDPAPKKVQAMLDDKNFIKGLNKALSVLGVPQG